MYTQGNTEEVTPLISLRRENLVLKVMLVLAIVAGVGVWTAQFWLDSARPAPPLATYTVNLDVTEKGMLSIRLAPPRMVSIQSRDFMLYHADGMVIRGCTEVTRLEAGKVKAVVRFRNEAPIEFYAGGLSRMDMTLDGRNMGKCDTSGGRLSGGDWINRQRMGDLVEPGDHTVKIVGKPAPAKEPDNEAGGKPEGLGV